MDRDMIINTAELTINRCTVYHIRKLECYL